jgi:hypothetical protein
MCNLLNVTMAHLPAPWRVDLLIMVLATEICCLPTSERQAKMAEIIKSLPDILKYTEEGMRQALVDKARNGQ